MIGSLERGKLGAWRLLQPEKRWVGIHNRPLFQ
nr:MAG TPA: hypothetical protein [Caudoviricetes sp.]